MEHLHYPKEVTCKERLLKLVFILPLITEVFGLLFFILGTVYTFSPPEKGRLTHGSPATIAWQGLQLFLYSLLAVLAWVPSPKVSGFVKNRIILKVPTIIILLIAAVANTLAAVTFIVNPIADPLSFILSVLTVIVLIAINLQGMILAHRYFKAKREAKKNGENTATISFFTGFNKEGYALNSEEATYMDIDEESEKNGGNGLRIFFSIIFWTFIILTFIVSILTTIQSSYEAFASPNVLPFENFFKI